LATMAFLASSPAETLQTAMTTYTPCNARACVVSSPMPLDAPAQVALAHHQQFLRRKCDLRV
jgi:hypothetical protein